MRHPVEPRRDRILTEVTAREGWEPDRSVQIQELCALVSARYPDAKLDHLRHRLRVLFPRAVALLEVGQPSGKKPSTHVRDELRAIMSLPRQAAVKRLLHLDPLLEAYLELRLEGGRDAVLTGGAQPDVVKTVVLRYELLLAKGSSILPATRRGTDGPWSYIAELLAELWENVTGEEPRRSWDSYKERDSGPSLRFFHAFARMVSGDDEVPEMPRVWRNALKARSKATTPTGGAEAPERRP